MEKVFAFFVKKFIKIPSFVVGVLDLTWDVSSNNFLICTFMSEYNTEYMLMQIHTEFRGLRTCSVTHLTELKVCKKLKKPNVFY